MFRRLFRHPNKNDEQVGEQPTEGYSDTENPPSIPPPPTIGEQGSIDLASYRPSFTSEGPEQLIEVLTNSMPEFAIVVKTEGFDAKVKAIKRLPSTSHQRLYATFMSVGFQLQKVGRLEEALELEKLRLELIKLIPETETSALLGNTQPRNMADTFLSIGGIYADMGELSLALHSLLEAETWYEKDAQLRAKKGVVGESEVDRLFFRTDMRASLCGQISDMYRQFGDQEKAVEYDQKAWAYANAKRTDEQRLEFLFGQANACRAMGDYNEALATLNEALELALKLSQSTVVSRDVSRASIALGDVYVDLKLHRRALQLYEKSYKLNQSSKHHGRIIRDCLRIGAVHEVTGKLGDAIEYYQKALCHCSIEYKPTRTLDLPLNTWEYQGSPHLIVRPDEAWDILHRLGKIEKARQAPRAVEYLGLAINVIESLRGNVLAEDQRIGFQGLVIDVYETMIELQLELWQREKDPKHLEALFSYIERAKSRVLTEQLADLPIPQPQTVPQFLLNEEIRLSREIEELERLLAEGAKNTIVLADKLTSVQGTLNRVWTRIEQEDPYAGAEYVSLRRAVPLSVDDIRKLVKQVSHKVAIVEYYLTSQNLIVVVIFSDKPGIACHVMNVSREEVRELALVNPDSPPSLDLRIPYWQLDLAPLLIEPISDLIANYELICFVPHDVLHCVPLHALHLSENDSRTCAQIAGVFYVPSASLLKYCRNRPSRNRENNLVLGNPKRDDQAEIPHTMEEAQMVADLLECPAFVEDQATKSLFLKKSKEAEYIHIACHGEFKKDEALSSALLLADGDLTAKEIFDLSLRSELVVLSACETGINENRSGDELIGFVRALLYAGTPSVVLSLWNAYDESASRLMISFYDGIIHQGLPKAKALSLAQRELIESGFSEAQWAPFILVGDWE
jgi:CHAT domain-containing protein